MRYLFINGHFPQYSQTFVHDQIELVKSSGVDAVEVYARSLAEFRFEQSVPECAQDLIFSKPINTKLVLRIIRGALLHPLRAARVVGLFRRKKINCAVMKLLLQLREAPNILVTHFGSNIDTSVQIKKYMFPDVKNVIIFHGHDISFYIQNNGWAIYKAAEAYVDCAICVNNVWKNLIIHNTSIKDVRTIYLGTKVRPLRRRRNGDSRIYSILFVGRFVEKKGFDLLYQAVNLFCENTKYKVRVHCVGDGPLWQEFKNKAAADGFNDRYIFYGAKQKRFVLQLMDECDILVAPSRTASDGDSEGIPLVLMEGMMCGIPVLSTFHSGIPELIEHMVTGLLVAENNVAELANQIAFAASHPRELQQIAERARLHVVAAHDEAKQVQSYISAFGGKL